MEQKNKYFIPLPDNMTVLRPLEGKKHFHFVDCRKLSNATFFFAAIRRLERSFDEDILSQKKIAGNFTISAKNATSISIIRISLLLNSQSMKKEKEQIESKNLKMQKKSKNNPVQEMYGVCFLKNFLFFKSLQN